MAFALNLDPNENRKGELPTATLTPNQVSITFYAAAEGINYMVQSSTDMKNWTTGDVTLSALGADGRRTAFAMRDAPSVFCACSSKVDLPNQNESIAAASPRRAAEKATR